MDTERDPVLQEAARGWKRRGFVETGGGLGTVQLVKYPDLSVPLLVFWILAGVWPGLLYLVYWKLKSEDHVSLSLTPGGVLLVDREVSWINRVGAALGWFYAVMLGLGLVGLLAVLLFGTDRNDTRKVQEAKPVFQVAGMPVFHPGTPTEGPTLRWEGTLTNKSAVPWPAADLECRVRYVRGTGEMEMRASRSALGGHGQDTWAVEPLPTPARPFLPGETRRFHCETTAGKPVGVARPTDAVMDVIVQAPNGRFAWTTGPTALRPANP
ncbi:MAG: hypothetical protein RL653_83 [Pseudomonadota bacterium]|jgi:hypothetical protein